MRLLNYQFRGLENEISLEHFRVDVLLFFFVLQLSFFDFGYFSGNAFVTWLDFFGLSQVLQRQLEVLSSKPGLGSPVESFHVVGFDLQNFVANWQSLLPFLERNKMLFNRTLLKNESVEFLKYLFSTLAQVGYGHVLGVSDY